MPINPPTRPRKTSSLGQLSELENTAAAVDERLKDLEEDAIRTRKVLWGNGEKDGGVTGRLLLVEQIIGDVKKLLWAILGIVLGIALGGIYQAILHAAAAGK